MEPEHGPIQIMESEHPSARPKADACVKCVCKRTTHTEGARHGKAVNPACFFCRRPAPQNPSKPLKDYIGAWARHRSPRALA